MSIKIDEATQKAVNPEKIFEGQLGRIVACLVSATFVTVCLMQFLK